jgi:molecular chaperone GrpE
MTEASDSVQPNGASHDWDEELKDLVDGFLKGAPGGYADEGLIGDLIGDQDSGHEDSNEIPEAEISQLLAERTADLQRLQAEYVNYKRRVDRDRDQARQRGIEAVLADLLPVLDGVCAAKAHGELDPGLRMLADEVAKVAGKYGLVSFGEEGDTFDPHIHEALMHVDKPGYTVISVAQVIQQGYRIGERVVRPARVAVAGPDEPDRVEPT